MVGFTADSEGDFETQTQSTDALISVAKLVIVEGAVEPTLLMQRLTQMVNSSSRLETTVS